MTVDFINDSAIPHNLTLVNSANKTLGETPTFDGGDEELHRDAQGRHLHLLLLSAGPSRGRHAAHADRQVGALREAHQIPTLRELARLRSRARARDLG